MSKKIVFFGSGLVAEKSLTFLKKYLDIELIITKSLPGTKHNNVVDLSTKMNLPVETINDSQALSSLINNSNFSSKLAILIDYGVIVPQQTIDFFQYGIINSHFSVLPDLRGPDPITYSILSGQSETGVSLMKIVEKLDEGPLLDWQTLELNQQETSENLTNQLIDLSNQLIKKNIVDADWDNFKFVDQTITKKTVSYSKKLQKSDGKLDFNLAAEVLERQIRAFDVWPKSFTTIKNIPIIITKASIINKNGPAGRLFIDNHQLGIYCQNQALMIEKLKPAGKNLMSSTDFLNGYKSLIVD